MGGLHARAVLGVDTVFVFVGHKLVELVQRSIRDLGEEVLEASIDLPVGRVDGDAGQAEEDGEGEKEEEPAAGRHPESSETRRRGGGRCSSSSSGR
jgi:hypothetical protein